MILVVVAMDLTIREELEDRKPPFMRHNHRVIFDSPVSLNLRMSHRIGIMVDESIETVGSQFHIDDGLLEVVQHMMQLRTILHV